MSAPTPAPAPAPDARARARTETGTGQITGEATGASDIPAGGRAQDVNGASDPALVAVGDRVLQRIDYPWRERLAGWDITFMGPRPGFLGATITNERRIEIYVDGQRSVDELAFTVAHELGHAVDLTLLNGTERDGWLAARGVPGEAWWAANAESDYAVGAGDWAEAFAVWQLGGSGYSTLAGPPTPSQLALLARLSFGD
ncbi:MAG: ImmA/IrrE family metallo-endopeptidase [Acidimicrobiales bacterium]